MENGQKYDQDPQKNLDSEKELAQADNRSDSKSPKKSNSNSYSGNSRRNSSDGSDFELGQKKSEMGYSQSFQNPSQKDQNLKQPKLDFLIFISTKIKDSLLENKILDSIISQIGGISMDFDLNFKIPEYNGCLLKIKSDDIRKKRDATQHLLEFIVKHNLDHNPNEPQKKGEKIAIIIMIPNGLVSMIIGTRGKQISNLIEESQASIVINQPIYKMTYRTVTISGYPEGIAKGVMLIQQIMEERYNEVNTIEFECPPLNVMTTQTNVKIVLPEYIIDKMYSKRHGNSFVNIIKDKYDVTTKVYQEYKNRQLDKKDMVCSFKGTINHVQDAIMELSHKIKDDIRSIYDGKESYQLKILINKVFVTKLIGAGGCMIQEIANFAKGASIKIMSNKNDEKKNNFHDIPLCIAGGFYSVQDATCIIIEQMECFKNGGPVLKSGKSLHDNIAVQFMNSIFTNALPGQSEDAHTYTLKERFNQANEENSGNNNLNNNGEENMGYESNQNDERIMDEMQQRDREKFKDFSDPNMMQEYPRSHYYSRSRSRSRSRNRERDRSKSRDRDRYRRDNQRSRSKKYSRSNSRNHRRSRSRTDDYRKRRGDNDRERDNNNSNRNYQRPYSLFSYIENGVTKINTYFTVPDHLVSLLIGKKGENVRAIMNSTGAVVTFCKEYNDDSKINTSNGIARLCNLKGTIKQNMEAMGKILELVVKFESGNNQQPTKEK